VSSDAALIETSLVKLAERGIELRHGLYERFFAAYPARRADFLCPEATGVRMTDETLQMMHGLASDESWVWPLVAELSYTHRAYGRLPFEEYEAFVDLTVTTMADALGDDWSEAQAAAWGRQAERLKAMIHKAQTDWERVLPR
jgi:hemoglobin-like flavoprotein